jgi:4-hydroxy-tetrahydrodipicolinate reductase
LIKKIKYGLVGSTGRLGREVAEVFSENDHELVFDYSIEGETRKEIPELIIDCSLPQVLPKTIAFIEEFKVPLIIATTGLSESDFARLKSISAKLPVVQSYNYSIGIQVLLKLTEMAKEKLNGWDIEITESHHRFKKDKPSGTAKMISNVLGKKVNISSLRLGNVPGDHTIAFGALGEVLSISHRALSRRTFAEGIYKTAEFIITKKSGFYSFNDVLA